MVAAGYPANRNVPATPHFRAGQQVRARNMNPVGHTRLPRYTRSKSGQSSETMEFSNFPDTSAKGLGEKPSTYIRSVLPLGSCGVSRPADMILSTLIMDDYLSQLDSAARFGRSRRAQRKGEHA